MPGTAILQDPKLVSNMASRFGGAIYVLDCAVNFLIQHARASSNQALAGGAVAAESAARLGLDVDINSRKEANQFSRNVAAVGGAVYYLANRQGSNNLDVCRQCFYLMLDRHTVDSWLHLSEEPSSSFGNSHA